MLAFAKTDIKTRYVVHNSQASKLVLSVHGRSVVSRSIVLAKQSSVEHLEHVISHFVRSCLLQLFIECLLQFTPSVHSSYILCMPETKDPNSHKQRRKHSFFSLARV